MFTRILKGYVGLLCFVAAIVCIYLAVQSHSVWIFLLSVVVAISVLLVLGVYSELCNHVMDIHIYLKNINREIGMIKDQTKRINNHSSESEQLKFKETKSDVAQIPSRYEAKKWTCSKCGRGNEATSLSCSYCNEKRTELVKVPDGYWKCPGCATVISNEYKKCWHCGYVNMFYTTSQNFRETHTDNETSLLKLSDLNSIPLKSQELERVSCPSCGNIMEDSNARFCNICGGRIK